LNNCKTIPLIDKRLKVLKKELNKNKKDTGVVGHDLRSKIYELEYLKEQILRSVGGK